MKFAGTSVCNSAKQGTKRPELPPHLSSSALTTRWPLLTDHEAVPWTLGNPKRPKWSEHCPYGGFRNGVPYWGPFVRGSYYLRAILGGRYFRKPPSRHGPGQALVSPFLLVAPAPMVGSRRSHKGLKGLGLRAEGLSFRHAEFGRKTNLTLQKPQTQTLQIPIARGPFFQAARMRARLLETSPSATLKRKKGHLEAEAGAAFPSFLLFRGRAALTTRAPPSCPCPVALWWPGPH